MEYKTKEKIIHFIHAFLLSLTCIFGLFLAAQNELQLSILMIGTVVFIKTLW
jgi:cytochrome b subunit of formate dehydrogenase